MPTAGSPDGVREADAALPRYARVLTALAHPVRADLLDAFDDAVASPSELAARIRQPLPHVVHHIGRLVELDCVELVERRVVAGGVQRFYRRVEPPWFEHADFEPLGPAPRKRLVETTIRDMVEALHRAARAGALSDAGAYDFERRTVELDERGWRDLDERVSAFVADVQRIVERASTRLESGVARNAEGTLVMLLKFPSVPRAGVAGGGA